MTAPTPASQPTPAERETGEELQVRLAEALDIHLTERDYSAGCAMRCGYDGDERALHLAAALLPTVQAAIDQARADGAAEALEAAAERIAGLASGPVPAIDDPYDAVVILRARADEQRAAIRKSASERTTR